MDKVDGKTIVEKKGMGNVTRDGFEYELDVFFDVINNKHLIQASKDRTRLFADKPEFIITEQTGKDLLNWSNSGKVDEKFELESTILNLIRNAESADQLKESCTPHIEVLKANTQLMNLYKNKKESFK